MNKLNIALSLPLLLILASTMPAVIYYNAENCRLSNEINDLRHELATLKTANLTAALGVTEIPPQPHQIFGSKDSHLWITGWVLNSGASKAIHAGLTVLAFDETNAVVLNVTVPVTDREFSTAFDDSLVPAVPYWLPGATSLNKLTYGDVLSEENVTVRFSIFHDGIFPSSTRYQIIPIWENKT
jgi:hypothetical protein